MGPALTRLSSDEYERLLSGEMTPSMAAAYLQGEHLVLRSFGEMLREFYPCEDIHFRLTTAFAVDSDPASAGRKVSNWLSGKNHPTNREDLFRIAFALDLTENQANYLLGLCTGYGIHYRDGRDVIYAWFLRTGRGYADARDFYETLPPPPRYDLPPNDPSTHITQMMRNAFLRAHTPAELRECYMDNLQDFGLLHTRAFSYFDRYMGQLIRPTSAFTHTLERDYSLETIMDLYFHLNMPSSRNRSGYTVAQKLIKNNWPNATTLKDIYARRKDVPRKLLLLLYIITENIVDQVYNEFDEDYTSDQARIEDHWLTINAILTDCGMPKLDLRNASDWLIMYAVTAVDTTMSEKLEQTIEYMFQNTGSL